MQNGSLLLLYDLGTGLQKASPQHTQHEEVQRLLALGTASKAVRLGSGRAGGQREGPQAHASPSRPAPGASQIQVFLLRGTQNRVSRVLVRVERINVFSVEHNSTLELADSYYLGGVPPDQLPPRCAGGARVGGGRGALGGRPDARPPQPAAALPLRRLDPRLRQGHQGAGQVRGSQEAEHHRRQLGLHCRPAGEHPRPAGAPAGRAAGPSPAPSRRWDGP